MPSIEAAAIRKVLDSRGEATVEVDVVVDGVVGRAAAPSGAGTGGGRHAAGGTTIQESLGVARGPTAAASAFANARVHRAVREILRSKLPTGPLGRGDEGAGGVPLGDEAALAVLVDACRAVSKDVGFEVSPAVDFAASEYFRDGAYRYRSRALTPDQQVEFVADLVDRYGLWSVEAPLDEDDFAGHARLTALVGSRCHVIGDDLFATDTERLREGVEGRWEHARAVQ